MTNDGRGGIGWRGRLARMAAATISTVGLALVPAGAMAGESLVVGPDSGMQVATSGQQVTASADGASGQVVSLGDGQQAESGVVSMSSGTGEATSAQPRAQFGMSVSAPSLAGGNQSASLVAADEGKSGGSASLGSDGFAVVNADAPAQHLPTSAEDARRPLTPDQADAHIREAAAVSGDDARQSVAEAAAQSQVSDGQAGAATDYTSDKQYVFDHMDPLLVGDVDSPEDLVPADILTVTTTVVDSSTRETTIDSFWGKDDDHNGIADNFVHLKANNQTDVFLYEASGDSDYYVAKAGLLDDSNAELLDTAAALNDLDGHGLSDVRYDRSTGLAYVPKHYRNASLDSNGNVMLNSVKLQNMYKETDDKLTVEFPVMMSMAGSADAINETVSASMYDSTFSVAVPDQMNSLDNYVDSILINGVRIPDDAYRYDHDGSSVVIAAEPSTISSIDIVINKDYESIFDKLVASLSDTAYAFTDDGQGFSGGNYAGRYEWHALTTVDMDFMFSIRPQAGWVWIANSDNQYEYWRYYGGSNLRATNEGYVPVVDTSYRDGTNAYARFYSMVNGIVTGTLQGDAEATFGTFDVYGGDGADPGFRSSHVSGGTYGMVAGYPYDGAGERKANDARNVLGTVQIPHDAIFNLVCAHGVESWTDYGNTPGGGGDAWMTLYDVEDDYGNPATDATTEGYAVLGVGNSNMNTQAGAGYFKIHWKLAEKKGVLTINKGTANESTGREVTPAVYGTQSAWRISCYDGSPASRDSSAARGANRIWDIVIFDGTEAQLRDRAKASGDSHRGDAQSVVDLMDRYGWGKTSAALVDSKTIRFDGTSDGFIDQGSLSDNGQSSGRWYSVAELLPPKDASPYRYTGEANVKDVRGVPYYSYYLLHISHATGTWDSVGWVDTKNGFHAFSGDLRAGFKANDYYTNRPLDNISGHARSDDDWAIGGEGSMHVVLGVKNPVAPATFKLSLTKVPGEACLSGLARNFNLAGATYYLYDSNTLQPDGRIGKAGNWNNVVKDSNGDYVWFITDKNGVGHLRGKLNRDGTATGPTVAEVPISAKAVYLQEWSLPKGAGWKLDQTVYAIGVKDQKGSTKVAYTVKSSEQPVTDPPTLVKLDKDSGTARVGAASVDGAQFKLEYWDVTGTVPSGAPAASATWTYNRGINFRTQAPSNGSWMKLSNGYNAFPVGLYRITETKAPNGFEKAGPWLFRVYKNNSGLGDIQTLGSNWRGHAQATLTVDDPITPIDISIDKTDADAGDHDQGDASVTDATFDVIYANVKENQNTIKYGGKTFRKGDAVATLSYDKAAGKWHAEGLPFAVYVVREHAPADYRSDATDQTVTPKVGQKTYSVTFRNHVKRNTVTILKRDAESPSLPTSARFTVVNKSKDSIVWNGKTIDGVKNGQGGTLGTFATDSTGKVTLADLPIGTYAITEVSGATADTMTDQVKWGLTSSDGATSTVTDGGQSCTVAITAGDGGTVTVTARDQAVRGDVAVRKLSIYDEPVKNASFSIYNVSRDADGNPMDALVGVRGGQAARVPSAYADYEKLGDPSQRQAWIEAHKDSLVCSIVTDGEGVASTVTSALGSPALRRGAPDGQVYTYVILETSPASVPNADGKTFTSYELDTSWFQTFSIGADPTKGTATDGVGAAMDVTYANGAFTVGQKADLTSGESTWPGDMTGSGISFSGDAEHQRLTGVQMPLTGGAGIAALVAGAAAAAVAAGAVKDVRDRERDGDDPDDADEE